MKKERNEGRKEHKEVSLKSAELSVIANRL